MASAQVLLAQQQDQNDKVPTSKLQPERAPSLDVKKLTASIHTHGNHLAGENVPLNPVEEAAAIATMASMFGWAPALRSQSWRHFGALSACMASCPSSRSRICHGILRVV